MSDKVIPHPTTQLLLQLEAQRREIQALKIDNSVLKDLLCRTVRIVTRIENSIKIQFPPLKKPSKK